MYMNIIIVFSILVLNYINCQNPNLGIHVDPGDELIRVVNLSEKFSIESEIDPDGYYLGPSDKLGLNIIGSDNKTYILSVTPTGEILIPQIGTINISGLTINESKKIIKKYVRNNAFSNATIELVLLNIRKFKLQIIGAVNNPGFITVSSVDRLTNIVAKAGGLHKYANEDSISIKREDSENIVSLRVFKKNGDLNSNPLLMESDVIFVPYQDEFSYLIDNTITFKETSITVTGFVNKPSTLHYKIGYTVIEYIGFSGGVSDMGSLKNVKIYRDGTVVYPSFNDIVLPGDQIYIPANIKYRLLGNVSILQTLTAIMSLILTFQAATAS